MRVKAQEWLRRYIPAEITGLFAAVLAGVFFYTMTNSAVITAHSGVWGENIGFYGTIIVMSVSRSIKYHHNQQSAYGFASFARDARNIVLEFGPAEAIDSLVTRPFMMYICQRIFGDVVFGLVTGKLAADIMFYIPTIIAYELRKRYLQ